MGGGGVIVAIQKQPPIIIVKKRRSTHTEDDHSSSWKIAFADFAIAMMALFMVLWIIEATSKEERKEIENILQHNNLFGSGNSDSVVDFGGRPLPFKNNAQYTTNTGDPFKQSNVEQGKEFSSMLKGQYLDRAELIKLAEAMQGTVKNLSLIDNLVIEAVPQGLRILIRDSEDRVMFRRSSATITPHVKELLFQLTLNLAKIKNRIIISGHTDSTEFNSNTFTNWELSAQRAMTARQIMVKSGLPEGNVIQVVAMAERMLIDEVNPKSGKNRRIELMVLTSEADTQLQMLFGVGGIDPNVSAIL